MATTVTGAVIDALEAVAVGWTVHDGIGDITSWPAVVVFDSGALFDGDLGGDDDDAVEVVLIHAHGLSREQASWARAKVADALHAATLTVDGRKVSRVALDVAGPMVVDHDLDPEQSVFTAPDRWRVWTTKET